jgi:hypothetical protein
MIMMNDAFFVFIHQQDRPIYTKLLSIYDKFLAQNDSVLILFAVSGFNKALSTQLCLFYCFQAMSN